MLKTLCIACKNNWKGRGNASIHLLPLNKVIRNQWLETLGMAKRSHPDRVYVCSNHFNESDILKLGRKTHLRPEAFPLPYKGVPYEKAPKVSQVAEVQISSYFAKKLQAISAKATENYQKAKSNPSIDQSSNNVEKVTFPTVQSIPIIDITLDDVEQPTLPTEQRNDTNLSENINTEQIVKPAPTPQKIYVSKTCQTAYIDSQQYLSPYPVWYIHSYMAGHHEVQAVPFTSVISRHTQTGIDSDSDTEERKSKRPSIEISCNDTLPTVIVTQNENLLKVAIFKAYHQMQKWKAKIKQKDSKIRAVQKTFRRADMRVERLQQQIKDNAPSRRRRKQNKMRAKRVPRSRKNASSISSRPAPAIENTDECTLDLNNSVLSKEDVLDISHLSSIADFVEVGQVIQLPILGTNESVNVIVTGVPPGTMDIATSGHNAD